MTIFFSFLFFSFMSTLKDFRLVSDVLTYIDMFLGLLGNTELGQQVSPSCTCVFLKIFLQNVNICLFKK